MEFCLLLKNMGKNIGKNISKYLSSKYGQKILITLSNPPQMHLKQLQKRQFKKQKKQLVISLAIKQITELQNSHKLCHRLVQKQLKMKQKILDLLGKNLNKVKHPKKKDKKILMI